jgi:hypothetical protein
MEIGTAANSETNESILFPGLFSLGPKIIKGT